MLKFAVETRRHARKGYRAVGRKSGEKNILAFCSAGRSGEVGKASVTS